MFSLARIRQTLPIGAMAVGAVLLTHGLLEPKSTLLQSAILRRALTTGAFTWAAVYAHDTLNERYGQHVVVRPTKSGEDDA